jgi:GNAT superfamily N-acetyltransferase
VTHTLRLATLDDLPPLDHLVEQSVRQLSAGHYTPAQIDSALRFIFGVDTQLISDGTYYVIDAGGVIAAAGGWSRRQTLFGGDQFKTGPDPLLDPAVDAARIRAFFVHPHFARRGLARSLFEQCLTAARAEGFGHFELASTVPGEALYRSLGFEVLERYAAAMPDGNSLPLARMTRRIVAPTVTAIRPPRH